MTPTYSLAVAFGPKKPHKDREVNRMHESFPFYNAFSVLMVLAASIVSIIVTTLAKMSKDRNASKASFNSYICWNCCAMAL